MWLRWAGRLSALLTVTCRHPNPSVIAPGLAAGMCPTCFALHLSQSCPQLQNNLALSLLPLLQGVTPCVSCHLTHLWLTVKLGIKRLLPTSQEQSSWRPFEAIPLQVRRGSSSARVPIVPFMMLVWIPGICSSIPPRFLPSPTLHCSWHSPRLSLPPKYL